MIAVHFDSQPGSCKFGFVRRGLESGSRELFVSSNGSTNVTALLDDREAKPCGK